MLQTRRRTKSRRRIILGGVLIPILAGGSWWLFHLQRQPTAAQAAQATAAPASVADSGAKNARPRDAEKAVAAEPKKAEMTTPAAPGPNQPAAREDVVLVGIPTAADAAFHFKSDAPAPADPAPQSAPASQPAADPPTPRTAGDPRTGNAGIEQARALLGAGKSLEARDALSALLKRDLGDNEQNEARALLTRLADDTIFGRHSTPGDPLTDTYIVQSGDALAIIPRAYDVPYEALMLINGIKDASLLRAGQKLRVVHGPFNAKIYKSKFRLDVYLQDVYVRSFRVGLGKENGTPEGVWKVKNRLENPTYYPPASAEGKQIISPDDPNNPLGEHWIGLEGTEGEALGHEGYGIHGTIEPESIGKAVSMGCIRMHNEDVALLFKLLQPGKSTVTIYP